LGNCEFVSLGCFCGASAALQSIGLRGAANPFDWVRSPVEGIIQCFETDFEDFLTFTKKGNLGTEFLTTRWGGSFWHHDVEDAKVREDFTRRIQRMLGLGKVPASRPRAFVRAVNSTRELEATLRLHNALQRTFPETTVYLLVLIDLQEMEGPVLLEGSSNVLFFRIHKDLCSEAWSMKRCSEAYSQGISFAVRYWAGLEDSASVASFPSLAHFSSSCAEFDGGSPANELFWPRRFQGQKITVRRPSSQPDSQSALKSPSTESIRPAQQSSGELSSPSASPCKAERDAEASPEVCLRIPAGTKPGDEVEAAAFGQRVRITLLEGMNSGQLLQLRCVQGAVTYAAVAAATTATSMAITMVAAEICRQSTGASMPQDLCPKC
jgi:hypothetical protein